MGDADARWGEMEWKAVIVSSTLLEVRTATWLIYELDKKQSLEVMQTSVPTKAAHSTLETIGTYMPALLLAP